MKHLFNDISQDEKDRILEMHKGAINSEMINEQPARFIGQGIRKGAQYAKQFVDDTGRALGRTLNPQKVRILGNGGFNPSHNTGYDKPVGELLERSGLIENNQFVQNELKDFDRKLFQFDDLYNKIYNQYSKSNNSTAIGNILDNINIRMKTPLGKPLDLGSLYELLLRLKNYVRYDEYHQIARKTLEETIEVFETVVAKILSQGGR
jgi:hypothetical protein